jgi:secretion/DNA translocation related TadE-like protein
MRSPVSGPARERVGGRSADQRGVAAPMVVTLTGLLLVLCLLGSGLCRLLVDQRRAASAADLAALAGAAALQRGAEPCAAAVESARRNAAELVRCTVEGEQVAVRASVRSPGLDGLLGAMVRAVPIEAEAHAGPVG